MEKEAARKRKRAFDQSLRIKLILPVMFTMAVSLGVNLLLFSRINRTVENMDQVYITNIRLGELEGLLTEMEDSLYQYLNIRSQDGFQAFARAREQFEVMIEEVDDRIIRPDRWRGTSAAWPFPTWSWQMPPLQRSRTMMWPLIKRTMRRYRMSIPICWPRCGGWIPCALRPIPRIMICCTSICESREALTGEPIRIGAIYALSGNNAAIGTNILRGTDLAAEDINQAGGVDGRPVQIVRGDTQGDPQVARQVAERLITEEKVHAIVGCHQSTLTEIVAEVCEQYKVPMITAISTVDSISTHDRSYFFRLCPMNSLYLENMFMYLRDQAEQTGKTVKTIAVFADNSMIGQEAIRCAHIYAPRYGMEIVKEIQYGQGAADLTEEIRELAAVDADAVLAESYISDAILLMKTMEEQGYRPPILIAKANGFADPSFIPATGDSSNGLTSVVEWNPDLTKGQEINRRFKEIFGMDMNGHSAESYTAVWTLKTAFEQAGSDKGEAVRDALAALDIQGAFPGGPEIILPYDRIKFEDQIFDGTRYHNENIYASVAIAQIQDGEYKTVWPFGYTDQKILYPAAYR